MGELLLLMFLAFVVVGPSDFPKVARGFIKAVKYAKNLAADLMGSLTQELEEGAKEAGEVKNIVEDTLKSVETAGKDIKDEIESIMEEHL